MKLPSKVFLDQIVSAYKAGQSMEEIGRQLGYTFQTISRTLLKNGIETRRSGPRPSMTKWGPDHHMWRGQNTSMPSKHRRISRRFGDPPKCEMCGLKDADRMYDWANLTGNYDDFLDYKRMCRPCHWMFDCCRGIRPSGGMKGRLAYRFGFTQAGGTPSPSADLKAKNKVPGIIYA